MYLQTKYNWHAVYTRSRYERKLYKQLVSQNIECYLPLKVETRQWSDRIKVIEEPLLRSYLFVKVSNKEYYTVLNTDGAVRYVAFNGEAAIIPEKQMEDLKLFLIHFNRQVEVTQEDLIKGDQVLVKSGLLKGVRGEIIQFRGKDRIVLRFRNLGYCVHMETQFQDVQPIDE